MKRILCLVISFTLNVYAGQMNAYGRNLIVPKEEVAKQKVVLVVGGSRGIGLATAEHLAEQGYRVYGSGTKPKQCSKKFHCLAIDIRDESSIGTAINHIIQTEGRVDVVVNSAAVGIYGPAEEVTLAEAKRVFDVNVFGAMRVMNAVLPQFRKQGYGLIINISSMAAVDPVPGSDWYAASKYALEGLTESMASYLPKHNIHLVLVEPGPVNTQFITETSKKGTRYLPDKPYGNMTEKVFDWHKDILSKGQDPNEVAKLIHAIIETPHPHLRYQTSPAMQKLAKRRYVDPTGNKARAEKQAILKVLTE